MLHIFFIMTITGKEMASPVPLMVSLYIPEQASSPESTTGFYAVPQTTFQHKTRGAHARIHSAILLYWMTLFSCSLWPTFSITETRKTCKITKVVTVEAWINSFNVTLHSSFKTNILWRARPTLPQYFSLPFDGGDSPPI